MVLEELSAIYNPWCILQQPAHPGNGIDPTFRTLLAAIDHDWAVIDPVYVTLNKRSTVASYVFVLTHKTLGETCWIAVSASPEVERFLLSNEHSLVERKF